MLFKTEAELSEPRCGIARWTRTLDDEDQAHLDNLVRNSSVTADTLVEMVAPYYQVSVTTMRRHRRSVRGQLGASGCGCE